MKFFLATVFLFLLTGCFQVENIADCQQPACKDSLSTAPPFPLAKGNKWNFQDSVFTDSGVFVESTTVWIHYSHEDTLGTWWTFRVHLAPFWQPLLLSNDTVFGFVMVGGRGMRVPWYIPPAPSSDTVRFQAVVDDDLPAYEWEVISFAKDYQTPTGNFSGCALYRTFNAAGYNLIETVLCRGVGPVAQNLTQGNVSRKRRLISRGVEFSD